MGSSGEPGRCEHGKLYAEFCWDCVDRSALMGRNGEAQQVRTSYVSTKCGPGVHDDCVTGPYVWRGGKRRVNRGYSEYCTCPCHLVSNRRYLRWVKQKRTAHQLKAMQFRFWWRWF